ncbi:MAG: AAA family ATPase [Candidatus Moranbacteria bacterium]|nr:AAA family ATPase [Candidatus Moranbacteria bacterium]
MLHIQKKYIDRILAQKPKQGVFIFSGPSGVGKRELAFYLVDGLIKKENKLKNFKTVGLIEEKNQISIKQIHEAISFMKLKSEDTMVCLIQDGDRMSIKAQNALLKVLEEPNEHKIFIIITDSIQNLLSTIVSRSLIIKLGLMKPKQIRDIFSKQEKIDSKAVFLNWGRIASLKESKQKGIKELEKKEKKFYNLIEAPIWKKFEIIETLEKDEDNLLELVDFWIFLVILNLEIGLYDDFKEFKDYNKLNLNHLESKQLLEKLLRLKEILKFSNASKKLQLEASFI